MQVLWAESGILLVYVSLGAGARHTDETSDGINFTRLQTPAPALPVLLLILCRE